MCIKPIALEQRLLGDKSILSSKRLLEDSSGGYKLVTKETQNSVFCKLSKWSRVTRKITFLVHCWWKCLTFSIDYCIDKIVAPVPSHLKGSVAILVLKSYFCSVQGREIDTG